MDAPNATVVFETPGLIDMRAFTTMGLSAKPASANPIGYFGTGLKYAMATLCRLGGEPEVLIGEDRYAFRRVAADFRGTTYEQMQMLRSRRSWRRPRIHDLPFTTRYGRNWQAWQAFRELEANTRDENGRTYLADGPVGGVAGRTLIACALPDLVDAFYKRDEIFLPDAARVGTGIQVVDRPSGVLYWRGLRVYEVSKPCFVTWNFLDYLTLTEDRTLAAEWYARRMLADWVAAKCDDEALIERVVTASGNNWEGGLEFNEFLAPSAAFHRVMLRHPRNVGANALGYYSRYDERPVSVTLDVYEAHPRPWKIVGAAVHDANGTALFDRPLGYRGDWAPLARRILQKINAPEVADEPPPELAADEVPAPEQPPEVAESETEATP